MHKYICIVFCLSIITNEALSQGFLQSSRDRRWMATASLGGSSYFGDLNPPQDFFDANPNASIGAKYHLNDHYAIRSDFFWYRISGDDKLSHPSDPRYKRNLSFFSNNFEFNISATLNFVPEETFFVRPLINPYLMVGIGVTYFNPKTEYNGQDYALRPMQLEGVAYSPIALVVPFGGGISYRVHPFINISFEISYRLCFTDFLDDVSTVHKDPASFSDPVAAALADRRPEAGYEPVEPGTQRGHKAHDGYSFLSFRMEYYLAFSKSSRDIKYRNPKNKYKKYLKRRKKRPRYKKSKIIK